MPISSHLKRVLASSKLANNLYGRFWVTTNPLEQRSVTTPVGEIEIKGAQIGSVGHNIISDIDKRGGYEPELVASLQEVLMPDSVFFDVGAGMGFFPLVAVKHGVPPAQIHAFEAHPVRSALIETNASDIQVIKKFVGAETGHGTIALDDYCPPIPDVVKIDVEGAELDVLKGMREVLRENHPVLFVEIHPQFLSDRGETPDDILDYLKSNGYSTSQVELDHVYNEAEFSNGQDNPEFMVKASHF